MYKSLAAQVTNAGSTRLANLLHASFPQNSCTKLKPQKKSYDLFGLFGFSAQRSNPRSFKFRGFIFTSFYIPTVKKSEKILPERVSPLSRSRPFEPYSFPTSTDRGTNQIDNP